MRRALSLLLIAFLVLRGLVGTAMAAGMLPPVVVAHSPAMAAQPSDHHGAMDHTAAQAAHCDDSEAREAHDGHAHTPCADGHGSTCTVCEICHATMLLPAAPPAAQGPAPTAAMARTVHAPANAPVALAHKPPIA